MNADLFGEDTCREKMALAPDAILLRGFARDCATELFSAITRIAQSAPLRHMQTPGGFRMSVAMTNTGTFGWITDRRGYRYENSDPETGHAWPAMPAVFVELATTAAAEAGFIGFKPDACLINRYAADAKMSLHQDRDETDLAAPIVSVSLGLPATFLFGGLARSDRPQRVSLVHGDIVVWGGVSRLAFHGVASLPSGTHPLTGEFRYNLTFRKAT